MKLQKKLALDQKMLVGKPGLDGHSNGAEQIAVRARDIGLEVVYDGIRSSPEQLANTCIEEEFILWVCQFCQDHIFFGKRISQAIKKAKISKIPVVIGGIIPPTDEKKLIKMGISAVFTPKNFQIFDIMSEIVEIIDKKLEKKISEIAVESLRLLNKYKLEEFVPIIIRKKKLAGFIKKI